MSSTSKVIWRPQAGSQEIFLSCPVFEVLYEGTRGPGKTDALIMDYCQHVGRGFGEAWRGILFRQTYKQLTDVIAKTKKWIPQIWPQARYNNTEHVWVWPTGENLFLRQYARQGDYWNYHGHEYPWIGWEELCNWSDSSGYRSMMSTCRSSEKGLPRKYRSTSNPYGPGHNWVKHRWRLSGIPAIGAAPIIRDSLDDDGKPEPPRVSIHGDIQENKVLLEASPDYIDKIKMAARNNAELEAWLHGNWDVVAGGMFDDVWSNHNIVKPFPIPSSWRIDRSFDWGSSHPFSVGWWAESDGSDVRLSNGQIRSSVRGDLFRIAEWYGWTGEPNEGIRMLSVNIAHGIVEREVKWGIHDRVKAGPADTSIFDVEDGRSIAVDMGQPVRLEDGKKYRGVYWTRADKARKTGWEQMRRMISEARPMGVPRESPGLFVFATCSQFLRTVPVLPRKDTDMDDVDSDAEDHIADEARYRVRSSKQRVGETRHVGMF